MRQNPRFSLSRRTVLGVGATVAMGAVGGLSLPAWAQTPAATAAAGAATGPWLGEKVYGSPTAPVTVIEYASLSCGHCAEFHKTIWPKMKARFVDNGQVKLIFRDYPSNLPGLRAHSLIRCGGEKRFDGLKDVLFKAQASWLNNGFEAQLARYAKMAGISDAQYQACIADKNLENFLIQSQLTGTSKFRLTSTPTFIIEKTGAVVVGALEKQLFDALIDAGAKPAATQ